MVFRVFKTNDSSEEAPKPCDEAIRTRYLTRRNDKVQAIHLYWTIEINGIRQLTDFINRVGPVIISETNIPDIEYEIEIYDDDNRE